MTKKPHRIAAMLGVALLASLAGGREIAAQQIFANGFSSTCSDPLIAPPDFPTVTVQWHNAFSSPDGSPMAAYPNSVGFPVPIGASKGGAITIPFVPTANLTVDMSWDPAQANGNQGYPNPRPSESMFFSISNCAADLRAPLEGSPDPFLSGRCRAMGTGASLIYSTRESISGDVACKLQPGVVHYLTVSPVDPSDGISPFEHTCSDHPNSAFGCDVQVRHSGNVSP
jgi:hypothetical protein